MDKKLAFVFPGQGSQSLGMLSDLAKAFPSVIALYHKASEVLGYDLWELAEKGPEEDLNRTEKTQPALLCAGVAVWEIWCNNNGPRPVVLAGHSLGEYTALVCAEAIDFKTAVQLVADRGHFMQSAVPEGKGEMAAIIGLDDGRVEEICEKAAKKGVIAPANYNSMGQVVVAGETAAVDEVIRLANDAGAKLAKVIKVSVPSHCQLMKPAAEQLAKTLEKIKIKTPKINIINNIDAVINADVTAIKEALIHQLTHPVRWVDTILKMREAGVEHMLECGPGKVLTGLIRRIDRGIKVKTIVDQVSLESALCFE